MKYTTLPYYTYIMKKGVRDYIITCLQGGALTTSDLVTRTSSYCNATPQAVYKTLTVLRTNDIITISKRGTSLSLLYIEKEMEKWQLAHRVTLSGAELARRLTHDKTKVAYSFANFHELDLFWTHSFTIVAANVPTSVPRYMLTPHDFFLYTRPETDSFWIKKNVTEKHTSRLIVPYALPLDKEVIKERRSSSGTTFEFLIGINPLKQKEHIYYNILGDYIFTGTMDKEVHEKIVAYIANQKRIPRSTKELAHIQNLIEMKGHFTLTIERHKKKAGAIEKKLQKYF